MSEQKQEYRTGDLVKVVHLGGMMSHFRGGLAIISSVERNSCQNGSDWEWDYGLVFIDNNTYSHDNSCSWYHNSNLEMIEKGLAHKFKIKEATND